MRRFRLYFTVFFLIFFLSALLIVTMAQSTIPNAKGEDNNRNVPVIIGTRMPNNIESLRLLKELKLGNGVLTFLPEDKQEAIAMAKYCRENKIYLSFWEFLYRGSYQLGWGWGKKIPRENFFSKEEIDYIIDEAGSYYFGRYTIGEIGCVLYAPESYEIEWRGEHWQNLPAVRTMEEAKNAYVDYVRRYLDFERKEISKGPLINVEAGMIFKYLATEGLDKLCLESMPGDPHLMHASIRGAARAFNKPWGTHIAMEHYGGVSLDELWQKRWKTSLYYSYISGAQYIWKEEPPLYYSERAWEPQRGFNSPEMKRSRKTLREAYQFTRIHTRPPNGPKVRLGIIYGNNDGTPGLWNRVVWGQYGDEKWLEGAAERSWNLVNKFYRKEEWSNEKVQGEIDFSGNPPYGQYDAVPIEASIDVLQEYSALVFLGWNTMTEEIYEKLKKYVSSGGHLVMYLPHLSTETDRANEIKLFRSGDFADLFGVRILGKERKKIRGIKCMAESSVKSYRFPRWRVRTDPRFIGLFTPSRVKLTSGRIISGYSDSYRISREELERRPLLIENSLGKGTAFLVTAWEFPADEGMIRFSNDLLRTILQGEQADIRLMSSDRIRYSVYEGEAPGSKKRYETIYMLNTDPDISCYAKLWVRGKFSKEFIIPANEMRLAYLCGDLLLVPEQKMVDLAGWESVGDQEDFSFFSAVEQKFDIFNMGEQPCNISINGIALSCNPGDHNIIRLKRTVDPSRKEFFTTDFLNEPKVEYIEKK